jgi:hypothetical protein
MKKTALGLLIAIALVTTTVLAQASGNKKQDHRSHMQGMMGRMMQGMADPKDVRAPNQ